MAAARQSGVLGRVAGSTGCQGSGPPATEVLSMPLTRTHRIARGGRVAGASVRALRRELAVLVVAMSGCGALLVLQLVTAISRR